MGLEQRQVQAEGFAQGFDADERRQGLGQGAEVPLANRHLVAEGITALVVGVVADEVGVEVVEEGERAEVEGDAEDRHVVGVHHPVAEAVGLPEGDQLGVALQYLAEEGRPGLFLFQAFGEMAFEDMTAEGFELFMLARVIEVLEVAEAHMAARQAQEHGSGLAGFPVHRGAGAGHAEGAAGGNAKGVQMLAGKELPNRAAQHRAAIAHARVGCLPGALQVQVPVFAGVIDHLAQQQAASITQARVVDAELMPGIDHRPRFGLGPELVPGEQLGEHLAIGLGRIQVEQRHGRRACHYQMRLGNGLGQHFSGEGVAQAGEAVVELQLVEFFHGLSLSCRRRGWKGRGHMAHLASGTGAFSLAGTASTSTSTSVSVPACFSSLRLRVTFIDGVVEMLMLCSWNNWSMRRFSSSVARPRSPSSRT
ncbi:hypothetical protein D3C85_1030960 [compost metagenome]